ncbi:hypothetical protein EVAR_30476_1 [Eumeta japonica]|uniref:Uncharacterized protein n=1 Tax=Eumeta variegata TaxID=151549 RepID=A0A4C1VZ46_EUMVA|nr:hypothetical protein EVAR_30476_1 [Eumeta japonica]
MKFSLTPFIKCRSSSETRRRTIRTGGSAVKSGRTPRPIAARPLIADLTTGVTQRIIETALPEICLRNEIQNDEVFKRIRVTKVAIKSTNVSDDVRRLDNLLDSKTVKRCCSAGFHARWNSSTKNGTDLRLGVRALLIIARLTVDEKTVQRRWFPRTVELFDEERRRLETYLP